jgi:hypothetical protein
VIAYYTNATNDLKFAKCNNASCSSAATSTLSSENDTGQATSIAIGSDGYPIISYGNSTKGSLELAKCTDIFCSGSATNPTGYSTSTLDTAAAAGSQTSISIGTDGFPVIAYYSGTGNLKFVKCNNVSCSSKAASSLDTQTNTGKSPSLAIGTDGYPVIAYQDGVKLDLLLAQCNNAACAPATSATGTLTRTNADLSNYFDDAAYTNVAFSDDIYDSIAAGTSTRLAYLFARKNTNNTDTITAIWEGQVSKATTTYLKIYNVNSSAWEVLASNTSPTPNTDFTLTGTQSTSLSNYYDGSNIVYLRIETGTTTASTTLKTDQISLSINIVQTHYRWRADNGYESTATYIAPEDIPLAATSSIYKGDRVRLRMLLNNAGGSTATNFTYRLEVASSSCANTYYTVPTGATLANEEWVMDLSQYILDGSVTSNSSSLTDPAGQTFTAGESRVFANTTGPTSLTTAQFSEYEYSIRSTSRATTNLLYCFRVTNAGVTTNFTYTAVPQVTLSGGLRPQAGGSNSEASGSGAAQVGGGQGGGAGSEGSGSGGSQSGGGAGGGGGDSG